MKTINLAQGSQAWLDWRQGVFTASDAPAMMGVSKYKSRNELIKEKATGKTRPITPELQAIFDEGHTTEDLARPIIEAELGESLYNVVATHDDLPHVAASFDGITMDDRIIFEHKVYRNSKASQQRYNLAKDGKLLDMDAIQVQQQLLVSNAEKCLFVVSDGTAQNMAIVEVKPDSEMQKRIIDGWKAFQTDLNNYHDVVQADAELQAMYQDYAIAKATADKAKAMLDTLDKQIKAKATDISKKTGANEIIGNGFSIAKIKRKGAVDYTKIPELDGVDLEQFRKQGSEYFKITAEKQRFK